MPSTGAFRILAGGEPVGRLVSTYAEIRPGEVCALFGSTDHLEIAANAASAAERLGLARTRWWKSDRLGSGSRLREEHTDHHGQNALAEP